MAYKSDPKSNRHWNSVTWKDPGWRGGVKYSPAVTTRQKSTYRSQLGLWYVLSETRMQKEMLASDGKKTERTHAMNVFLLLSAGMRKNHWEESRNINTLKKRTRPMSSHLDRSHLVNKGFIIWLSMKFFFAGRGGYSRASKIAPSCLLG